MGQFRALLISLLVPVVAAAIVLATVGVIKDEDAAVAIPAGAAIGLVVVGAAAVSLSLLARGTRVPEEARARRARAAEAEGSFTFSQGVLLLVSFAVLTAVPAGVVVGAVVVLKHNNNFTPSVALPVILLVGLIGLLAVLAMMIAVFRRFGLVSDKYPLGLPEGSIQAVIALSLILIFAIIGVYLHASTTGAARHDVSTQLLTTVSTLVVAVAGFYFGSKTTHEAAESIRLATSGEGGTRQQRPPNTPRDQSGSEPEANAERNVDAEPEDDTDVEPETEA